jgi:hypothetical protein
MNEITDEACELFLSKFPLAFEDELFSKFEEMNQDCEPSTRQLIHPPKFQFPLKNGILYKRGDQVRKF